MQEQQAFHKSILDNMADGVMALDMKGSIIMFNPAAGEILGLKPDDVLGQAFGAVFLMISDDNDDFNQLVLDAVYQHSAGINETVDFTHADGKKSVLSVTCSYLAGDDGKADEPGGVVVVMNDISEVCRLQQEEKELRGQIQDSYIRLEESNQSLKAALRRMKVVRWASIVVVALLMLGAGVYAWTSGGVDEFVSGGSGGYSSGAEGTEGMSFTPVQPQPISTSISLSGKLEPIETVNVVAPFAGRVLKKSFSYGQRVNKGDLLFTLDTSELMVQLRDARSAYIKARQNYQGLNTWTDSNEVSRAKRSYVRSKAQLESARSKMNETKVLFDKGIVPKNEYDSTIQAYQSQQLDLKTSEEELASVMEKADPENMEIAAMELENARTKYTELERRVQMAEVRAPVEGVVIQPPSSSKNSTDGPKLLEVGISATEGNVMVAVANLEGLSVRTEVDEVDIGKLSLGQKVRVSGDAFPGIVLRGNVEEISSQARSGMNIPKFDVTIAIDAVSPEHKRKVRLGMSATLEVTVYDNPDALLVPIEAVQHGGEGAYVMVRGAGGSPERRTVTTGMTTMTSVEITSGLKSGDAVGMYAMGMTAMPAGSE